MPAPSIQPKRRLLLCTGGGLCLTGLLALGGQSQAVALGAGWCLTVMLATLVSLARRRAGEDARRNMEDFLAEAGIALEEGREFATEPWRDRVPAGPIALVKKLTDHQRRQNLMGFINQGAVVFGPDLQVTDCTPWISTILNDDPVGQPVNDAVFQPCGLGADQVQRTVFLLRGVFGMPEFQWQISAPELPGEASLRRQGVCQYLGLRYYPVFSSTDQLERIVLVVSDITAEKQAREELDRRQAEMDKILALLEVSESIFNLYMDESTAIFENLKKDLRILRGKDEGAWPDAIDRMLRDAHTLRGNSRLFKLSFLHDACHQLEDSLVALQTEKVSVGPESVRDIMEKLMEINEEIYSYTSLRRELLDRHDNGDELAVRYRLQSIRGYLLRLVALTHTPGYDLHELDRLQWDLNRALLAFERSSLGEYVGRYNTMLQELAKNSGKRLNPVVTRLGYLHFEPRILGAINDALVHCLRNALSHGIETPEERRAAGKPEAGTITVETGLYEGVVTILCYDDGRGLDPAGLVARAVDTGLITRAEAATMAEATALELIFHPRFSTTEDNSELSGRGVGMNAVRSVMEAIGGQVRAMNRPDGGALFELSFTEESIGLLYNFSFTHIPQLARQAFAEVTEGHPGVDIELDLPPAGNAYLLSDRRAVKFILKMLMQDLLTCRPGCRRIQLRLPGSAPEADEMFCLILDTDGGAVPQTERSVWYDHAWDLVRQLQGTIRINTDGSVELGLPSAVPLPAAALAQYFILPGPHRMMEKYVEDFHAQVLPGREFTIVGKEDGPLEQEEPLLVIIDVDEWSGYLERRPEPLRRQDQFLLLASNGSMAQNMDGMHPFLRRALVLNQPIHQQAVFALLEAMLVRDCVEGHEAVHGTGGTRPGQILKRSA